MTAVTIEARTPFAGQLVSLDPESDVTSAMSEAGLLWGVQKVGLYGTPQHDPAWIAGHPHNAIPNWSLLPVPDRALMVRDDGPTSPPVPLAVVGSEYVPIPNVDAFAPLDLLRAQGLITFEQGGMTRDGRHVFLLARIGDGATLADVDPHVRYLFAKTSHDGTGALRIVPWVRRLHCTNQVAAIGRMGGAVVSIPHVRGAGVKVDAMAGVLGSVVRSLDTFDEEWRELSAREVTVSGRERFVTGLFPMPTGPDVTDRMIANVEERRRVVASLIAGPSNESIAGSRAALFAAATEWDQWYRTKDPRRGAVRVLEGTNRAFVTRAWDLATSI